MYHLSRCLAPFTGLVICATVLSAAPQISISPGLISTVASGTNNTLAGNPDAGGSGVAPSFNGVAFDPTKSSATLYVSDFAKHQVFKVDLNSGQVTPFAGNGTAGTAGDGGAAVSAQLNEPAGIAVDSAGNVYVADTTANLVRRIDTAGIITTVAGDGTTGTPSYSGDGPATGVKLGKPIGLAIDSSGSLYIAASTQGRILRLTSGQITTVAGNGGGSPFADGTATAVALQLPAGIAVDPTNNDIYLSETLGHVVRKISGGNLITVAGQLNSSGYSGDNGPGASAKLNVPYGLALDNGGGLYLADTSNHVVRKVTTDAGRTINTIGGTNSAGYSGDGGSALAAQMNGPSFVAIDRTTGNLYFVDSGNKAIRVILGSANPPTFASSGQSTTFTVSNTGDAALSAAAISLSSANYAVTGGSCGSSVSLAPGQSCTLTIQATGSGSATLSVASGSVSSTTYLSIAGGLRFVPVPPCRVVDTRSPGGSYGSPSLIAGQARNFEIRNSTAFGCPSGFIPSTADVQAFSLNVTVSPRTSVLTYATVFPGGSPSVPLVSTLNSFDGRVKANAAIVPVQNGNTSVGVFATDQTDVILDINGYYVPASTSTAQAYYPLPPCRVSDTRRANGNFGGPFLSGGGPLAAGQTGSTARTIPVRSSACNVPNTATAYSLNITAVPRANILNYLTVWPSDQAQPFVSTLNSLKGTVTANAAIVPASAGDGSISAYATENADLIVDINGYYAPAGAGGLSLYNVTPCRVFDSRGNPQTQPPLPAGAATQAVAASSCAVPANAQSYVLNTTVVPTGQLVYLANWAHGTAQPLQSTLNAFDGAVSSNLAIVPTIDGSVSSYATAPTALILDVFGYFAP